MAKLEKVIETALYCDDLELSIPFYKEILQLKPIMQMDRLCAFDVNGQSVLLLFQRGASLQPQHTEGGSIPPHDGHGPLHMAFAIQASEMAEWKQRLTDRGVTIISQVQWPLGGSSVYFHDPDGHVIELATPGVWETY
ncbi:MAG: VOC family protein [Chlamydiota bacterium]